MRTHTRHDQVRRIIDGITTIGAHGTREELMKIEQICSRPAVSVPVSAPLSEVAALMRTRNVGAIVVTKSPADRPVPVGIITDRDILRTQLSRTVDLTAIAAGDVMTRDPLVIREQDSVSDAIQFLRRRGVRRAPVIGDSGELRGMISTDDLVTHVAVDVMSLAAPLARQASASFRKGETS